MMNHWEKPSSIPSMNNSWLDFIYLAAELWITRSASLRTGGLTPKMKKKKDFFFFFFLLFHYCFGGICIVYAS
jgi:hypothetical protein